MHIIDFYNRINDLEFQLCQFVVYSESLFF